MKRAPELAFFLSALSNEDFNKKSKQKKEKNSPRFLPGCGVTDGLNRLSWKLQPLDLELQSFYLFYLTRIISLFTRRGQENMKPRALAMLCSSSSSLLFFLLILYFFLPSAPFIPHLLHGFIYCVRNNLSSTELLKRTPTQCVLLLHSASKQPFLGFYLFSFGWGCWGGGSWVGRDGAPRVCIPLFC